MAIYKLGNKIPRFTGKNFFVAESADIIGDVEIGNNVSIWFNAVLRGDIAPIRIGDDTNIQDGTVLHLDYNVPVVISNGVTIGHATILHGCEIEDNCLIGMGATILTGAKIGKNCIIGAHALVTQGKVIPDNSLVIGSPAKISRSVTLEEIDLIKWSAKHYVEQIGIYTASLRTM